jgi:hypothetical protein
MSTQLILPQSLNPHTNSSFSESERALRKTNDREPRNLQAEILKLENRLQLLLPKMMQDEAQRRVVGYRPSQTERDVQALILKLKGLYRSALNYSALDSFMNQRSRTSDFKIGNKKGTLSSQIWHFEERVQSGELPLKALQAQLVGKMTKRDAEEPFEKLMTHYVQLYNQILIGKKYTRYIYQELVNLHQKILEAKETNLPDFSLKKLWTEVNLLLKLQR